MTQFKLTGFRFNKLQWIAEKATQKMVLYLQPETKNELKSMSRSTFKILFYVNKAKGEGRHRACHGSYNHQRNAVAVQL